KCAARAGWGGFQYAPAPDAPDGHCAPDSPAIPSAAHTERQHLPKYGETRWAHLPAWWRAQAWQSPWQPARAKTVIAQVRRTRVAPEPRRHRADLLPACRWAAVRQHKPAGSAPSRKRKSGASHRALQADP